jgi:prepilin-type N-terminal cleavage/methylation domain-containing protein
MVMNEKGSMGKTSLQPLRILHGEPGNAAPRQQRGFSLLEMTIVLAILLVGGSILFVNFTPIMRNVHINNAYDCVWSAMRRAHDEAMSENRVYVVSFVAPRTIQVNQNTPAGPLLLSQNLPLDVSFDNEPGIPVANTPAGYGIGANAMDFDQCCGGGGAVISFYPDGSAHDLAGNLNNGVVYIARPGDLYSSRAITLTGATGRIRGWRLAGGAKNWMML